MTRSRQINVTPAYLIYTVIIILGMVIIGCSDDDKSTAPDTPVTGYAYYVDVNTGSDGNNGLSGTPFKTITHALSVAQPHDSIKVAPGTYNAASGETFPISIPDSVALIGDVVGYGIVFPDTIKIDGVGSYDASNSAAIVGGNGARLSGLYVRQPVSSIRHYCVITEDNDFTIDHNTLSSNYGCVRLLGSGNPVVLANNFESTTYYGVYSNCIGSALVHDNWFKDGTYVDNALGDIEISNNAFEGNASRAISIQHGNALVSGNTITGSYSLSALRIQYSGHTTVRQNTITQNNATEPCVQIMGNCCSDLGTAADPGGNTFTAAGGIAISLESDSTISALGNTWPAAPPVCGTNIVITSSGKVGFGTTAADTCSGIK